MHKSEKIALILVLAYGILILYYGVYDTQSNMWGFDALRYSPTIIACIFFLIFLVTILLSKKDFLEPFQERICQIMEILEGRVLGLGIRKTGLIIFAISLLLLTCVKTRYSGGDSENISVGMPLFLKRQPLSSFILNFGSAMGFILGASYHASLTTTITLIGASSITALFILFKTIFEDIKKAVLFLMITITSFGIIRLLPGYMETYGVFLFALIIQQIMLVRFLKTRMIQDYCLLILAMFITLLAHIQALVLIPGTIIAGLMVFRGRRAIVRIASQWTLFILCLALVYPHLTYMETSFNIIGEFEKFVTGRMDYTFWSKRDGISFITPVDKLISLEHLKNIVNMHALIAMSGYILLISTIGLNGKIRIKERITMIALMNFTLFFTMTLLFNNYFTPIERDWDMFGAGGVLIMTLTAAVLRSSTHKQLTRLALIILPITGFITIILLLTQAGTPGFLPPPEARIGFELI